ncbi:MAG: SDR family NAD(P)-dependent oxidoreductase [Candidatus Binatia bacterium]
MGRLEKRVAVLTGGAKGIGRAYARGLAREGADVAIVDIDRAAAEKVAEEVRGLGRRALAIECDVTNRAAVNAMGQRVIDEFGAIHALVNNAGVYPLQPWTEIEEDEWDRVLAINLKSCFLCARAVYAAMKRQGYGKIVNISSDVVVIGTPMILHYVSAKAGVIGFTRALAREAGPDGIRVNAILPGLTVTDTVMRSLGDSDEYFNRIVERQCIPGREQPEDLVGAMLYFCSPESDFVTGQALAVNGGFNMW